MANDKNRVFDWDDEIENDGEDFVLLPPGTYSFTVTDFERAYYNGSEKAPACNMAKLVLRCEGEDGSMGNVRDTLFLTAKNEWRLCQFFTAIGQRKHGERLRPQWNKVLGSTGLVNITYDKRNTNDDGSAKFNRVEAYLEPAETTAVPASAQKKWQIGK